MWNAISRFIGLSVDSDDDDDGDVDRFIRSRTSKQESSTDTNQEGSAASSKNDIEEKEFDGVVTSLHSTYGLINNEIFFTADCVQDGSMPKVGTSVHVVTWRKGSVGGWRAKKVLTRLVKDSFDDPAAAAESDEEEDSDSSGDMFEKCSDREREERAERRRNRDARITEEQQLIADKYNVEITGTVDFGQMLLGDTSSLQLSIT